MNPMAPALAPLATADIGLLRGRQALTMGGAKPATRSFADVMAEQTGTGKPKLSDKKLAEIDDSAKQFESMFIGQMLQPMFETVGTDPAFGGGEGEDTWKGMMIEQYGKQLSSSGGLGLSGAIKAKMIEMQEGANSEGSAQ